MKKTIILTILVLGLLLTGCNKLTKELPAVCSNQVRASGNCFAICSGTEYNQSTQKCEYVMSGSGCDCYTPFTSIEECVDVCE